jgi:hypothetical protein
MGSLKSWMLGAAMVAGGLGLGATTAHAARVGVYIGGPVAYVPPSPGPGYVWVAGYQANGYWVPGRWNFAGIRGGGPLVRGYVGWGRGPGFDRHFDPYRFRR